MAPKMFVAITLDHTLTKYNEGLVEWHNTTYNTKYETSDLNALKELLQDEVKIRAFENSNTFTLEMKGYESDVRNALNDLRHYYDFVILTTRSRKIERYTREWIDRHYNGIFEKLHFAYEDEEENNSPTSPKKVLSPKTSNASLVNDEKRLKIGKKIAELCQDFHIHLLIDKDLSGTLDVVKIPYKIHLKDDEAQIFTPLKNKNSEKSAKGKEGDEWLKTCTTWAEIRKGLEETASKLNLKNKSLEVVGTKLADQNGAGSEITAPPPAPKLSRYVDDLITITRKRSIAFYTKLILNKFRGQSELRLQGNDENIHAFIMVVNNVTQLRTVSNNAGSDDEGSANKNFKQLIPAKIASMKTSYMSLTSFYGRFRRPHGEKSKSLPVLKVTLKRTKEYEQFLSTEKDG